MRVAAPNLPRVANTMYPLLKIEEITIYYFVSSFTKAILNKHLSYTWLGVPDLFSITKYMYHLHIILIHDSCIFSSVHIGLTNNCVQCNKINKISCKLYEDAFEHCQIIVRVINNTLTKRTCGHLSDNRH